MCFLPSVPFFCENKECRHLSAQNTDVFFPFRKILIFTVKAKPSSVSDTFINIPRTEPTYIEKSEYNSNDSDILHLIK